MLANSIEDRIAVLSLNIALNVGIMLDVDYNIACRTGLQCAPLVHKQIGTDKLHGTVRLSLGPFNTEDDYDVDMLDGTPVLDIKPYNTRFEHRDNVRNG